MGGASPTKLQLTDLPNFDAIKETLRAFSKASPNPVFTKLPLSNEGRGFVD